MTKNFKGSIMYLMLLMLLSTTACGDSSTETVIIGAKSFSKGYYNDPDNKDEIEKYERENDENIINEIKDIYGYTSEITKHGDWTYYSKTGSSKNPLNKQIFRVKEDGSEDTNLGASGTILGFKDDWLYFYNYSLNLFGSRHKYYRMKPDGSQKTAVKQDEVSDLYDVKIVPTEGTLLGTSDKYEYIFFVDAVYRVNEDESTAVTIPLENPEGWEKYVSVVDNHLLFREYTELVDIDLENDEIVTIPYLDNDNDYTFEKHLAHDKNDNYFYFISKDGNWNRVLSFFKLGEKSEQYLPFQTSDFYPVDNWVYFTQESFEDNNLYRTEAGSTEKEKILDGSYHVYAEKDGWLYLTKATSYSEKSFSRCRLDGSEFSTVIPTYDYIYILGDWIYYGEFGSNYRVTLDGYNKKTLDYEIVNPHVYEDYVFFNDRNSYMNYVMNTDGSNIAEIGEGNYILYKFDRDYVYYYDYVPRQFFAPDEDSESNDDDFKGNIYKYNLKDRKMEFEKLMDVSPPGYLFDPGVGTYDFTKRNPVFDIKVLDSVKLQNSSDSVDNILSYIDDNSDSKTIYYLAVDFEHSEKTASAQEKEQEYFNMIQSMKDGMKTHFEAKHKTSINFDITEHQSSDESDSMYYRFILRYEVTEY